LVVHLAGKQTAREEKMEVIILECQAVLTSYGICAEEALNRLLAILDSRRTLEVVPPRRFAAPGDD
jgi:hypothetical protein